ncbi:MAG TPA: AMP-binding protein, partial [Myxococcales bacterium]
REKLPWDPEKLDWRNYWLEVHMAGLEEWVFPGLEEESEALRREIPQPKDLLALLAASQHAFGPRVALRYYAGEENAQELARTRDDRITYDELARFSDRAGRNLQALGAGPGGRVLLACENRPEWPMAYFGILKAGAAAAPVDHEMPAAEILNCARAAKASLLVASPRVAERLGELEGVRVVRIEEILRDTPRPDLPPLRKSAAADEVASILFTSGTTGKPKGVVLTHRNFASLAARLAGIFDLRVGEGVLSVLPLHHTFEFSCGLLTPLLLGAEITYLDELTSDRLSDALDHGRVHALVGVPALWQLLHRKLTQEIAQKPRVVKAAVDAAMALHGELRNRTDLNLGKLVFWPIHNRLGKRLRLLVSGGSALPAEVQEAFHELGFNLTEGYGLTEAAPVLAVTAPANRLRTGTVGPPLPGIELRIDEPNEEGVGEVLAKGPNVMAGYLDDPEATRSVLSGGWLRTGDLGRLDERGHLSLAGRKKDLILDASGKNVYPDELEELYASDLLKEISVVGLPGENGFERAAALCVPRTPKNGDTRESLRTAIDRHIATVSTELPVWKRLKLWHVWDGELPRTATRKVKRALVVKELQRLEATTVVMHNGAQRSDGFIYDLLASVTQKPRPSINAKTRLVADLAMDSLLLAELAAALDKAGIPAPKDFADIQTAGDLSRAVAVSNPPPPAAEPEPAGESELPVPEPLAIAGRAAISFFQKTLYGGIFDLEVEGQANIPSHAPFLVAANHASHLDVGLVKTALGKEGKKLASLAARDYFFDNPWKRAWFGNFTNLVPIERRGSLKESLRTAVRTLEYGYHLLIFPEGTRSVDGKLQEFKPAIAYLSFAAQADILPVYLRGTHEAMPKGAFAPDPRKNKKLVVRIGPLLRYEELRAATQGMARSAAHREVTRRVREAIEALARQG